MKPSYIVITALVLTIALLLGKMYIERQKSNFIPETATTPSITVSQINTPSNTPTISNKKGTIEGSLSYPSESLPSDMMVCAENEILENPICTSEKINDTKYTYRVGYKLLVPEGTYFVYAKLPANEYSAYYSEFVTCGLLASCNDHTPIEITVKANQTTTKVDPQDWYNIQPSM